jgi:hypothetical protein
LRSAPSPSPVRPILTCAYMMCQSLRVIRLRALITYLLHDLLECVGIQVRHRSSPCRDEVDVLARSIAVGNDGNENLLLECSAKDDLRGEARAEAAVARQRLLDESLEDAALAGRLVADDDDLRQVDEFTHATCEEFVDFFEHEWLREAILRGVVIRHGVGTVQR